MRTSKDLKEERSHLLEQLEAFAKKDTLNDDEKRQWDNLTKKIDTLDDDLIRTRKFEEQLKVDAIAKGTKLDSEGSENRETKTKTVWRSVDGSDIPVYLPSEKITSKREQPEFNMGQIARMLMYGAKTPEEKRALGEGINPDGGYTVPKMLAKNFVDAVREKSRLTQVGTRYVDVTSSNLDMAKIIADPTPAWRAEHGPVAESQPVFDIIRWEPKSLAMHVPVSWELLQDSANLEDMLNRSLTESVAEEIDRVALLGAGTATEPLGLANTPGVGSYNMGTNGGAITSYKPITQAINVLMMGNVEPSNIAAIMNNREYTALSELTDTTGQPLNRPGLIQDVRFLQTRKIPTNQVHGTATNASMIALGNFSDLVYGIRSGIKLEFIKNAFWNKMEATFLVHTRIDIAVLHPESFCLIKGVVPA